MEALGLVIVDCWLADAPLVTSCEPPPVLTPGLMLAPAFTLELLTPTSAFTPTFGFTLVVFALELPVGCDALEASDVDDGLVAPVPEDWLVDAPCDSDEDELVLEVCWLASTPLVTLCDPLPTLMPGLTFAPTFALELLTPTFASTPTLGFTLSVLDVEEPGLEDVEELEGVELRRLMSRSVELDVRPGADALPFRLMSVELDDPPGATAPFNGVDEELDPGTTAMPGTSLVVVLLDAVLLDCDRGALGTHPAGVVFAVSMHFGSRRPWVTLVMVSARATPKAAKSEAARRLILNVFRFIAVPPFQI